MFKLTRLHPRASLRVQGSGVIIEVAFSATDGTMLGQHKANLKESHASVWHID
jgi:hypothetical protein